MNSSENTLSNGIEYESCWFEAKSHGGKFIGGTLKTPNISVSAKHNEGKDIHKPEWQTQDEGSGPVARDH